MKFGFEVNFKDIALPLHLDLDPICGNYVGIHILVFKFYWM